MQNLKNQVVNIWNKGFFHVLIGNVLFAIVAFGSQLFVAKFLSDEELGYIKVFQSFVQIGGVLAGIGVSTSVLVLCADKRNNSNKKTFLLSGLRMVLPASIAIWVAFIALNYFNFWNSNERIKELFYFYSAIMIVNSLSAVFVAYLQANRVFKKLAKLLVLTKIFSLLLIVGLTYLYGLNGFMNGLWIGLVITLIINFSYTKKLFKIELLAPVNNIKTYVKKHLGVGLHGLGANLFGTAAMSMDIIMINYLLPDDAKLMGQYSFASIIIIGLNMIQGTVIQVATPFFSKYTQEKETVKKLYKKYSIILFFLSVVILVIARVSFPPLLKFVYQEKFDLGISLLAPLLFVWFFRSLNAINIASLSGLGKTNKANLISITSLLLYGSFIFLALRFYDIQTMIAAMILGSALILIISSFIAIKSYNKWT